MTANADDLPAGDLISEGRTAQVFRLDADRVVKVLRPGFPDSLAEEEAAAAALADRASIGAPRFHGLTRVHGRMGLIYERRDGTSVMQRLAGHPWRAGALAGLLGRLHGAMHATPAPTLPSLRAAVVSAIERAGWIVGATAREEAIARVRELPDGTALCHGDFHPGNVMLDDGGTPTVIDWLTAASGPPAADVARTLLLLRDGRLPDEMPPSRRLQINLLRRWFVSGYLRSYRRSRPLDLREVGAWRLPLLVARLDEDVSGEQSHLERLIAAELRTP